LTPLSGGLVEQVEPGHLAVGAVVLAVAAREAYRLEALRPSRASRGTATDATESVHPEVPIL
jgi:hypothetical protein